MVVTDPIADMLTQIRNASAIERRQIELPFSGLKLRLAELLKREGFIVDYKKDESSQYPQLVINLKYASDGKSAAIQGLKRVSKPGQRIYVGKTQVPRIKQGLGIAIISTPKGLLSDHEARKQGLGGEVICTIW